MYETQDTARRQPRRALFLAGLLSLLLLIGAFAGGMVFAAQASGGGGGGGGSGGGGASCKYNASHQLISGPSYCKQSNWSCVGTDTGGCVNGKQEVTYPRGCSPRTKYFTCGTSTTWRQAASKLVGCTSTYHLGIWQPEEVSSTGTRPYGNVKYAYASSCTNNPPVHCTPNGTLTQKFLSCVSNGVGKFEWLNSCNSVESTHDGAATRCDSGSGTGTTPTQGSGSSGSAPSCTVTTTYGTPEWTGCSAKGEETGTQSWTRTDSCSGTTSGTNDVAQHTSSACQPTVRHQCAYAKPGYAQKENCLTSPQGGYADCSGWSNPYYDTYDCPIPTPIGS